MSKKATNKVSCKVKAKLSITRILPYTLREMIRRLVYEIKKERMGKNRRAVLERQNTNRNTYTQKIVLKKKSL